MDNILRDLGLSQFSPELKQQNIDLNLFNMLVDPSTTPALREKVDRQINQGSTLGSNNISKICELLKKRQSLAKTSVHAKRLGFDQQKQV